MNGLYRFLLGDRADSVPEDASLDLVWLHAPQSWHLFVFLGVLLGGLYWVWWLYRREQTICPLRWRHLLAFLRTAAVVLIALILLGPAVGVHLRQTLRPVVLLLLDESLSMSLRDRYPDKAEGEQVARVLGVSPEKLRENPPTRAEVLEKALTRENSKLLRELAARGQLQVLSFAEQTRMRALRGAAAEAGGEQALTAEALELEEGSPLPPLNPEGQGSAIGRALSEAASATSGAPIAAVVLMTDGRDTTGESPARAAKAFAERDVPVLTVGVGDAVVPRNLAVRDVYASSRTPLKDPFVIRAMIECKSGRAERVRVELLETSGNEKPKSVAESWVELAPDSPRDTVTFQHRAPMIGSFTYTVRAEPLEEELFLEDNARERVIEVVDRQAKVLLVAGGADYNYRFLRVQLERDKTIELAAWLQTMPANMTQEGNVHLRSLPAGAEELFEYDVLILLDPDPNALPPGWIDLVYRFVTEHAGGLFWVASPVHSPDLALYPLTKPLLDLLPVKVDEAGMAPLAAQKQGASMLVPPTGVGHPVISLFSEGDASKELWEDLPKVYWSLSLKGAKPGAEVLLQHSILAAGSDPLPLLVAGRSGAGRVLFAGFNSMWRWRSRSPEIYSRFWLRSMRYLAEGRAVRSGGRGQLLTGQDRYVLGDQVMVTAKLYDSALEPLEVERVEAEIGGDGDRTGRIELLPVPGRPGQYQGAFVARQLGATTVTLGLDGMGAPLLRRFTVEVPQAEFADTRLDEVTLKQVAERSGGKFLKIGQADELPGLIPDRTETIMVQARPLDLWDNWRVMAVLAVILLAEWTIRRRMRLL